MFARILSLSLALFALFAIVLCLTILWLYSQQFTSIFFAVCTLEQFRNMHMESTVYVLPANKLASSQLGQKRPLRDLC